MAKSENVVRNLLLIQKGDRLPPSNKADIFDIPVIQYNKQIEYLANKVANSRQIAFRDKHPTAQFAGVLGEIIVARKLPSILPLSWYIPLIKGYSVADDGYDAFIPTTRLFINGIIKTATSRETKIQVRTSFGNRRPSYMVIDDLYNFTKYMHDRTETQGDIYKEIRLFLRKRIKSDIFIQCYMPTHNEEPCGVIEIVGYQTSRHILDLIPINASSDEDKPDLIVLPETDLLPISDLTIDYSHDAIISSYSEWYPDWITESDMDVIYKINKIIYQSKP